MPLTFYMACFPLEPRIDCHISYADLSGRFSASHVVEPAKLAKAFNDPSNLPKLFRGFTFVSQPLTRILGKPAVNQ
jgi:hypothetical protein